MGKAGIAGNAKLTETQNINNSTMIISKVINILIKGAKLFSYTDSKLTNNFIRKSKKKYFN